MKITVTVNQQTTYIEFDPESHIQILAGFKRILSLANCDAELINRLVFLPPIEESPEEMRIGETYTIG